MPLDGTPFAETALVPAAALATRAGATLDLVSVLARGDGSVGLGETVETAEPGSLEFADRLEEYVLRAMERVESEWGCEVTSGVLPEGEPADTALRSYMDRTGADLAVASTRVEEAPGDTVLGSVSRGLMGDAACPVLLIPAKDSGVGDGNGPLRGPVRSVAAVLEGASGRDRDVIEHAVRMARLWGAPLRVLVKDIEGAAGVDHGSVARWVDELGGRDVDLEVERVADSNGPDPLVAFLDRHEPGLVCVSGTRQGPSGGLAVEAATESVRNAGVLICTCG